MIQKYIDTRDHSAWTKESGDLMHEECIPQSIYLAHGKSKGEARGRNSHRNNARVVRNLEERNVGTKGKSPEQDLTSAKDLTIELLEKQEIDNFDVLAKATTM